MRIAIVGCGYSGSALGKALVAAGHECAATTTTPARLPEIAALGMRPVLLRLGDGEGLGELLGDRETVYLTLAAGRSGQSYRHVYVGGVEAVTTALPRSSVRRIVYTSSTRVYGQDDGSWVDEGSPIAPRSDEGQVLAEAERLLLDGAARAGRTATILRLGGIYGPGRDPAQRVLRLAGTQQSGANDCLNLVHLDDLVAALCACLAVDHHGELNLVDDTPTTRREYYDRLLCDAGAAPIHWIDAQAAYSGKRVRNQRIKRVLGLVLRHPAHA